MLGTSDVYFIVVYRMRSLSLDVLFFLYIYICQEPSIRFELFLYLWGGDPFVSVMSFVVENKATWILCELHRGWI